MTVASAARLGTTVLAGFQAVNSSWNFAMNMLDSVGIAGQTLVGAAMGAGDRARTLRLTRATGRAGLAAGAAIGCGFAVAGLFVGRLFSPTRTSSCCRRRHGDDGCVPATTGVDDGAGRHTDRARDFRYLAITCTLTATVYIALTAICVDAAAPMLPGDLASTVLLWAMFNIVLMGGRGLFNGLRIRGESWLGQTAPLTTRPATALVALRNTHLDITFASAEHHMIMASALEDGRRHAEGDSAPNQMTSEYSQISEA